MRKITYNNTKEKKGDHLKKDLNQTLSKVAKAEIFH